MQETHLVLREPQVSDILNTKWLMINGDAAGTVFYGRDAQVPLYVLPTTGGQELQQEHWQSTGCEKWCAKKQQKHWDREGRVFSEICD